MKKIRVFAVLLLCVALLAFAGCGDTKSDKDQDTENGTVTEETLDHDEETKGSDDGSAMDEMKDGAEKAVDDMKDAVDGDSTRQETKNK